MSGRTRTFNIISILHCFQFAFKLKINLNKSKLVGVGVSRPVIEEMTTFIGCTFVKILFSLSCVGCW